MEMQKHQSMSARFAIGAFACAAALFAGGARAAGAYFAVAPVSGLGAAGALRPVQMALASATPPLAYVGVYRIAPAGVEPFDVPCDQTTDGGGWTLVEYAADNSMGPAPEPNKGENIWAWYKTDFVLKLSDVQIDAIREVSATAR